VQASPHVTRPYGGRSGASSSRPWTQVRPRIAAGQAATPGQHRRGDVHGVDALDEARERSGDIPAAAGIQDAGRAGEHSSRMSNVAGGTAAQMVHRDHAGVGEL
jgi:hypothetical protein